MMRDIYGVFVDVGKVGVSLETHQGRVVTLNADQITHLIRILRRARSLVVSQKDFETFDVANVATPDP